MTRPKHIPPKTARGRPRAPFAERFWPKVGRREAGECWPWTGYQMPNSYGVAYFTEEQPKMLAHRAAWMLEHGAAPDELCVCHKCDNRICCNPAHLFLGTVADNNRDMYTKGRNRNTGVKGERHHAAKLTEQSVLEIRALAGTMPQAKIAAKFGVATSLVWAIATRRSWNHL